MKIHQTSGRRGIILLLVLGMLALFTLLTATYVVFTSQSRQASYSISQRNTRALDPATLLDQASLTALVGSQDNSSWLHGHSLLEDRYGKDTVVGKVRIVPSDATFDPVYVIKGHHFRVHTDLAAVDNPVDDALVGRYLTMQEGPLRHLTFRIVRSYADRNSSTWTAEEKLLDRMLVLDVGPHLDEVVNAVGISHPLATWLSSNATTRKALFINGSVGYPFLVNGRHRNGHGYGYEKTAGNTYNLNQKTTVGSGAGQHNVSAVLLPNYAIQDSASQPSGNTDEPYDVPDYRDMYLGHFPQNPSGSPNALGPQTPSFVRPALINYLTNVVTGGAPIASLDPTDNDDLAKLQTILSLLSRSTMRPLPIANSPEYGSRFAAFTGGGEGDPAFSTPINYNAPVAAQVQALAQALATGGLDTSTNTPLYRWDVDNDGDGKQDSVFVNAGLPLVTLPDGTLVQPMPAYRIEDLSGRVNVNTGGSLATMAHMGLAYEAGSSTAANMKGMLPRSNMTVPLIQGGGFGYGPAEIDLRAVHPSNLTTSNPAMRTLLRMRYGHDTRGVPGTGNLSTTPVNETIGLYRRANYPGLHRYDSIFGMPVDVWGRGRVATDLTGSPLIASFARVVRPDPADSSTWFYNNTLDLDADGNPDATEVVNDPYEAMLNHQLRGDREFSLGEFETILRRWDWDRAQLPQRLFTQVNAFDGSYTPSAEHYQSLTVTSSSDEIIPSHMPLELSESTDAAPGAPAPDDRLLEQPGHPAYRFLKAMGISRISQTNLTPAKLKELLTILPSEIRRGGKLDVNRPLGNGVDNDGDGVIDDPEELFNAALDITDAVKENFYSPSDTVDGSFSLTPEAAVLASSPTPGQDLNGSRQQMAKDLYCVMMALLYDPNSGTVFEFPNLPVGANSEDHTARRVAQWAINVVDFRDPDTIMTRFVYDTRPFDSGWDISASSTTRATVFGMEAPDLLLTESLIFHDTRLTDTPTGTSSTDPDPAKPWDELDEDLDQQRIPQGTAFLELYRPASPASFIYQENFSNAADPSNQNAVATAPPHALNATAADPEKLYWIDGNQIKLNFAAAAPVPPGTPPPPPGDPPRRGNPVFRIAISEVHNLGANPTSPLDRLADPTDTSATSFQTPQQTRAGGSTTAAHTGALNLYTRTDYNDPALDISIDRVVWMTDFGPESVPANNRPSDTKLNNVYWNRFNPTDNAGYESYLQGGQYAVIGPREDTYVGAKTTPDTTNAAGYHSPQRIELRPDSIAMFDAAGAAKTPGNTRSIVGIRAAAAAPTVWSDNTLEIGFSVSEPTPENYYPKPTATTYTGGPEDAYGTATDEPFDKAAPGGATYTPLIDLRNDDLRTGTTPDFRTAFLQRLADPTKDYDGELNPYITIDWVTLDLTVFNGEQAEQLETRPESAADPTVLLTRHINGDDPNPYDANPGPDPANPPEPGRDILFGARYKSGRAVRTAALSNLIYSFDTIEPVKVGKSAPAGVNVPVQIHTSTDMNTDSSVANQGNHSTTLGYLNQSFGNRFPGAATDVWTGSPDNDPFTWLPWFNRPFVSPYEIMFVPASAPGRLGAEIYVPASYPAFNAFEESPESLGGHYGAFFNLLSFDDVTDGTYEAPNVGRILDWVRTPQPYDALERFIDPSEVNFAHDWPPTPLPASPSDLEKATYVNQHAAELFRPPFNWSGPPDLKGKINLNTIVSQDVYRALMLARSRTATEFNDGLFWDRFIASRKAPAAGTDLLDVGANDDYPTPYPNAFQPRETSFVGPELDTTGGGLADRMRRKEHEVGLLRDHNGTGVGVFERSPGDATVEMANDPARHPFFHYDEAVRLPNLTSTNSNTFVMWVTVGLFTVDPITLNVGEEYGADQGTNTRYRAFYIIDRSVPVAFEPGKEHNVRNTIVFGRNLN